MCGDLEEHPFPKHPHPLPITHFPRMLAQETWVEQANEISDCKTSTLTEFGCNLLKYVFILIIIKSV